MCVFFLGHKHERDSLSLSTCQFCISVGSRDCSLCPLLPYVVCFAGLPLKDGALLGSEATYLAKIPLSFSISWLSTLSMYYISLIYVL